MSGHRELDELFLNEVVHDDAYAFAQVGFVGLNVYLGCLWWLVWCRYSREIFDLPSPRLLVQTLGVTSFNDLKRRINVDLYECQAGRFVQCAREGAVGTVWRDEGGEGDAAGRCEELGNLPDATYVLVPGLFVEAEILVESESDVVPVEAVGEFVEMEKVLLECTCDR